MDEKELEMTSQEFVPEVELQESPVETPPENKPAGKKQTKKRKRWVRILLITLCVILGLALLLLIIGAVFVFRWLNMIDRTDGHLDPMSSSEMAEFLENNTDPWDPNSTVEEVDPNDVTWETVPKIEDKKHIVNILLIGSDTRDPGERARSDSMILCTLNKKTKTVTMTSFLRDMYVQIPGYLDNRINASYAFGGMKLLNKTLEVNFGVHVDGNVVIEFENFEDVIDMVGGVNITLTQAEADYMNKYGERDSKRKGTFVAGPTRLDGIDALTYSRCRKIDSDFGRANRQRIVLNAVFEQCKNLSPTQLYKLLDKVLPLVTTDMSNGEILDYASDVIPMMSGLTIKTQHIPASGTYRDAWVRKMLVLLPNLPANRQLLEDTIGG